MTCDSCGRVADHLLAGDCADCHDHREAERGSERLREPSTLLRKQLSVVMDPMTARVRALGITVELGDPFPCILPGHEVHDAHVHPDGRHWRYSCGTGGRSGMLGEIRARIAYGEDCYVSRVEGARWGERLDHEAGLLNPAAVPLEAPRGASDALRRVIEGLVLMLGLRKAGGKFADEEFVFARRFVMAYCDVTDRQARHAIYRLEKGLGLIERVGGGAHSRDPIRWRLATATKVVNLADRRTA